MKRSLHLFCMMLLTFSFSCSFGSKKAENPTDDKDKKELKDKEAAEVDDSSMDEAEDHKDLAQADQAENKEAAIELPKVNDDKKEEEKKEILDAKVDHVEVKIPQEAKEIVVKKEVVKEKKLVIPEEKYITYFVKRGDSLSKISSKIFHTKKMVPDIMKMNVAIKNSNKIMVGEMIRIPLLNNDAISFLHDYTQLKEHSVIHTKVKKQDTLAKIAAKILKNKNYWKMLWYQNKSSIKNPNKIFVGQELTIFTLDLDKHTGLKTGKTTHKAGAKKVVKATEAPVHAHAKVQPQPVKANHLDKDK